MQWWGGSLCCRPVLLTGVVSYVEASGKRARVRIADGDGASVLVEVERLEVFDKNLPRE